MQDNIRIFFKDKIKFESIIKKSRSFNCTVNSEDIEKESSKINIYPIKGQIGSMTYFINENSAYLENSIHKYHNNLTMEKDINYNDFSYCNLTQTLDDLRNQIPEYDFLDTKITNLEFGFNIKIDRSVKDLIGKNILLHDFKPHYFFNDKNRFVMKKFKIGNRMLKIYDKGRQNNLPYELLRIELKYNTKQLNHKKIGIFNFFDLYDPYKNYLLFKDFLEVYEKLIIVDYRFEENLTENEIANLGNKLEYTYWKDRTDISDSAKYRNKKKFLKYLPDKNLNKNFVYLKNKILEKFNLLYKDCDGALPIGL